MRPEMLWSKKIQCGNRVLVVEFWKPSDNEEEGAEEDDQFPIIIPTIDISPVDKAHGRKARRPSLAELVPDWPTLQAPKIIPQVVHRCTCRLLTHVYAASRAVNVVWHSVFCIHYAILNVRMSCLISYINIQLKQTF